MIPVESGYDNAPFPGSEYLTPADLEGLVGEDTLRRLLRESYLVALDGNPCWEADRLAERLEGGRP
jgi:hypothetical protein